MDIKYMLNERESQYLVEISIVKLIQFIMNKKKLVEKPIRFLNKL